MRVFLAGASGALGQSLLPLLVQGGHEVIGATRSSDNAVVVKRCGATPVIVDLLNARDVSRAVFSVQPEAVVHEATALSGVNSYRNLDRSLRATNRLRTQGLDNLVAAAAAAGANRFIAQSFGGWPNGRTGPRILSEDAPLETDHLPTTAESLAAIRHVETSVPRLRDMTGVVLRYGQLCGPRTSFARDGAMVRLVQKRSLPVIGGGRGVWSFVHVDDAATATVAALTHGEAGIYNVVDDDPAEVATWLPLLASFLDAKRPYSIPASLGRLLAGDFVTAQMMELRGLSNQKARQLLGWRPSYSSWRTTFRQVLSQSSRSCNSPSYF